MYLAKKWPKMVIKWPFVSCDFSVIFLTKLKKTGNDKNCVLCCRVDQIGVQISWAPQNDRQNLNFMRDINEVAEKMARNGLKIAKSLDCAFHFESEFITVTAHLRATALS